MHKLKELLTKHVPELLGEQVDCNCGVMLLSVEEWTEHVALEIAATGPWDIKPEERFFVVGKDPRA